MRFREREAFSYVDGKLIVLKKGSDAGGQSRY